MAGQHARHRDRPPVAPPHDVRPVDRDRVAEDLLRRVQRVLEDVVPRRERADVRNGSSGVVAVDDVGVDHTETVHGYIEVINERTS